MRSKIKFVAAVAVFALALVFTAGDANAQYGHHCHPGYRASYGYSYAMPYGYSSYYSGYPGYSSYYSTGLYSGVYMGPGYTTARVVVPQPYPVYRPVMPYIPAPGIGIRIGF
ncbi:MAG: hypothetical protein U0930_22430 [Pirellulales bacterium]